MAMGCRFGSAVSPLEQVIGPDCDRDLFALIDFDDREPFDLHRSNTLLLSYALLAADIGRKKWAANRLRDRYNPSPLQNLCETI